jgi:hypothetical protein
LGKLLPEGDTLVPSWVDMVKNQQEGLGHWTRVSKGGKKVEGGIQDQWGPGSCRTLQGMVKTALLSKVERRNHTT